MLLFTKKVIISQHAKERYLERVAKKPMNNRQVRSAILNDFQIKNVRKKTPKNEQNEFKLWVFGSRLYVCNETDKTIVVKTVIQMLPEDEKRIIKEIEEKGWLPFTYMLYYIYSKGKEWIKWKT